MTARYFSILFLVSSILMGLMGAYGFEVLKHFSLSLLTATWAIAFALLDISKQRKHRAGNNE